MRNHLDTHQRIIYLSLIAHNTKPRMFYSKTWTSLFRVPQLKGSVTLGDKKPKKETRNEIRSIYTFVSFKLKGFHASSHNIS